MAYSFEPRKSHLRVWSGLLVNIAAGFMLLSFGATEIFALTIDALGAIISALLAVRVEDILEEA